MERTELHINGISTSNTYEEGDCYELVNLRKKNGALMPVAARAASETLPALYSQLFLHRNENYLHRIGVRGNAVYWVKEDGTEQQLMTTTGRVSITQVGNVLNVLDEEGIAYLLWSKDRYVNITLREEDVPEMTLKVEHDNKMRFYYSEILPQKIFVSDFYKDDLKFPDLYEVHKGLYSKAKKNMADDGYLTGFCLAICALKLKSGGYIYHSAPVMLGQAIDEHTRYVIGTNDYEEDPCMFMHKIDLDNYFSQPGHKEDGAAYTNIIYDSKDNVDKGYYEKNTDLIRFYRKGEDLSMYDTWYTPPLFCSVVGVLFRTKGIVGVTVQGRPFTIAAGNELKIRIGSPIPDEWTSMVSGVSVFITDPVQMGSEDKVIHTLGQNVWNKPKSDVEIGKELMSRENFYEVGYLSTDEIAANVGQWVKIDLRGKLGENLYSREILPVEANARNKTFPRSQFVYNNKLHLYDYAQTLFDGHPITRFFGENGIGQFSAGGGYANGCYWWTETEVKTASGLSTVVRSGRTENPFPKKGLAALLSYPDRRALSMTIYLMLWDSYNPDTNVYSGASIQKQTFKLTPHPAHNFSYYLSKELKPITLGVWPFGVAPVPEGKNNKKIYPNGLMVSDTNNPLLFAPINHYTVGTGTIFGMQSNRMNVGDRNFGQYPVYVATSAGWFMLTVGSAEAAYTNITPISSGITPVNGLMCSTPYGVVFVGARGLYMIGSEGADLFTEGIEQGRQPLRFEWNGLFSDVILRHDENFSDYLRGATALVYNPHENELIVVNGAFEYVYVVDVDDRTVYKSTDRVGYEVQNSYPNLLTVEGIRLKDYSKGEVSAHVSFITRPIAFGTRDIKQIDRVFLRGLMHEVRNRAGKGGVISLWQSNDGVHFTLTRAFSLKEGNLRDIDMGLLSRTKCRWVALGFGATLRDDSLIVSMESNVKKEYNNDKQR